MFYQSALVEIPCHQVCKKDTKSEDSSADFSKLFYPEESINTYNVDYS